MSGTRSFRQLLTTNFGLAPSGYTGSVGYTGSGGVNGYTGSAGSGGTPYRKNYAGIGYTYDSSRDAFIPPKPFNSWLLDEDTCLWQAPIAMPDDGQRYQLNEQDNNWLLITE